MAQSGPHPGLSPVAGGMWVREAAATGAERSGPGGPVLPGAAPPVT